MRAIQRIPTWQGLDGFQKSLHALDDSSLSSGCLIPFRPLSPFGISVWSCDTFENNLRMTHELRKYLKESSSSSFDGYFSFKYFTKYDYQRDTTKISTNIFGDCRQMQVSFHTVPTFDSCIKCLGKPGIIHNRMPHCHPCSFLGMDAWPVTS